jgi:AraC-like DNA-binding protein
VRLLRHDSPAVRWEMAHRAPHPALRGLVSGYVGYEERRAGPLRRREVPHGVVTLVLSFGDAMTMSRPDVGGSAVEARSFVSGLTEGPVVTAHRGRQHGVQVDLYPLGAYVLLGVPQRHLANDVVPLDALLGGAADRLVEQLALAPGWEERFALLDGDLLQRLAVGVRPAAEVERAWRRVVSTAGRVPVEVLADEVGWSRRHLAARFREQVGLPPKRVARVLRFEHALRAVADASPGRWADVAVRCGYYDQAHLARDFRDLAGLPPGRLLALRSPDGGFAAGEPVSHLRLPQDLTAAEVTFVQDGSGTTS